VRGAAGRRAEHDNPAGATIAAPIPCTTREAMSRRGSTASPPATLATTKTISPIRNIRAWPNRSASLPPSSRNPPKATAYPLISHCSVDVPMCRPVWIEGSATLTMVKSSTIISWAIPTTPRTNQRRRPGSPA
jgi:hypothetical protein